MGTHTQHRPVPLIGSGMPTTAASEIRPVDIKTSSISAGPVRLPATLMVSSERPSTYQKPVFVPHRPVALAPFIAVHGPVAVEIAFASSRHMLLVLPIDGVVMTSSPSSPTGVGSPAASRMRAPSAGHRAGKRSRRHRRQQRARHDAAEALGPTAVVEDRSAARRLSIWFSARRPITSFLRW